MWPDRARRDVADRGVEDQGRGAEHDLLDEPKPRNGLPKDENDDEAEKAEDEALRRTPSRRGWTSSGKRPSAQSLGHLRCSSSRLIARAKLWRDQLPHAIAERRELGRPLDLQRPRALELDWDIGKDPAG